MHPIECWFTLLILVSTRATQMISDANVSDSNQYIGCDSLSYVSFANIANLSLKLSIFNDHQCLYKAQRKFLIFAKYKANLICNHLKDLHREWLRQFLFVCKDYTFKNSLNIEQSHRK